MKKLTLLFLLVLAWPAWADNVFVTNGADHPVSVTGSFSASAATGAVNVANSQVTTSTTAGTLIAARPTRVSCLIRNTDAAITVYIGKATVTAGNGMPLKAGDSVVVTAQVLWQVIAASGTPVVAVADEYN